MRVRRRRVMTVQRDASYDLLGICLTVAKGGVDQRSRDVLLGRQDLGRVFLIDEIL
jgi:hypothetical protein